MAKFEEAISAIAKSFEAVGFKVPAYKQPKWYQFKQKKYIKWLREHNMPHRITK